MRNFFNSEIRIDRNLTLPSRALPSPMEGVMNPIFCRAADELKLTDLWITPFVAVGKTSRPGNKVFTRHTEPYRTGNIPVIVQLLGHDPEALCDAAKTLEDLGINTVNLNFACPSPQVLASGNGGACLKSPSLLHRICSDMKNACPNLSLSVKIRTGYASSLELPAITAALTDAGVPFLICHYRTVMEQYTPIENGWARLNELVRLAGNNTVVFGNGDIRTPLDAENMIAETHCAGIAVGRAILKDPFLLRKIKGEPLENFSGDPARCFLKAVIRAAKAESLGQKWCENGFIEYARMALEADSPRFKRILRHLKSMKKNPVKAN